MAQSTCGKCGGHDFELSAATLPGGAATFRLVQCASCGVPVGAIDPEARAKIESLRLQIAAIDSRLMAIAKALTD